MFFLWDLVLSKFVYGDPKTTHVNFAKSTMPKTKKVFVLTKKYWEDIIKINNKYFTVIFAIYFNATFKKYNSFLKLLMGF